MDLKRRILILLAIFTALYAATHYYVNRAIVLDGFTKLENKSAEQNMVRCVNALDRRVISLDRVVSDWANWDDIYRYAENGNREFEETNLVSSAYEPIGVNVIVIVNTRGEYLFRNDYDLKTQMLIPATDFAGPNLKARYPELMCPNIDSHVSGVLVTAKGPMLVAARPILTSDCEGPVRGTIAMCQRLDATAIKELSDTVKLPIRILKFAEVHRDVFEGLREDNILIHPLSRNSLRGYALVNDMAGSPAVLLTSTMPRDIMAGGRSILHTQFYSLILMALLLAGLVLLVLNSGIIKPITVLTKQISEITRGGNNSARVTIAPRGEIRRLSKAFNDLLDTREQVGAALRDSSARFEAVIENAPMIAIQGFDYDGNIRHCNAASTRFYGCDAAELIGRPIQQVLSSDAAADEFVRELRRCWDTQIAPSPRERFIKTRCGKERCVYSAMFPILERGAVVEIFCMDVDITERKQSESRFRDIAESMSDWIWEVDRNGRYVHVSERVFDVLGYTPEEILGKSPFHLMPFEEAERVGQTFAGLVEQKLPIRNLENWNTAKDGHLVCLLTNGVPLLDENGDLIGYRGVDSDITERRQIEDARKQETAKLSAMISGMEEGVVFADADDRIVEINDYFVHLIGTSREEVLGRSLWDLHPPHVVEKLRTIFERLRSHPNSPPVNVERRLGEAELLMRIQPIYRDGRYDGMLMNAVNVTELVVARRQAEQQNAELQLVNRRLKAHQGELKTQAQRLLAANAHLEAAYDRIARQQDEVVRASKLASLGTMAAGVAHEVNNPLVAVAGYSEVLLDRLDRLAADPSAELVEYFRKRLTIINDEAFRCKTITQGLLGFSRESSVAEASIFDVRDVLARAIELMSAHPIHSPESSAIVVLGPDPILVHAARDSMVQVFLNLGTNAFDALAPGETVYISAEREDGMAKIVFRDTGKGMDEETLAKIFDPFFTTKEIGAGTGLGMSVAQSIITANCGQLEIKSRPGEGTTVTVRLPLVSEQSARGAA